MGLIIGLMLSFTATTYADDIKSLVGVKIQGETPVIANGKDVGNAIIVDGKSYAPVRSISEAAGFEVKVENKQIVMTKKSTGGTTTVPEMPTMPVKKPNVRTVEQIDIQIYEEQTRIRALTYGVSDMEKLINGNPDNADIEQWKTQLQTIKDNLSAEEQKLAPLEAERAALIASQNQ